MAETAGLRVSFSTERSVQDELSRESSADAGTVLVSYFAMLMCVRFFTPVSHEADLIYIDLKAFFFACNRASCMASLTPL